MATEAAYRRLAPSDRLVRWFVARRYIRRDRHGQSSDVLDCLRMFRCTSRYTRSLTMGGIVRISWSLIACALLVFAAACSNGGGAKSSSTESAGSSTPKDIGAGWATAIKAAADSLRATHLSSGGLQAELNRAANLTVDMCRAAIADLRAATIDSADVERACEALQRAGGTPRVSAAPVYERAYDSLTTAGAKLSLTDVSDAMRRRIARAALSARDPTKIDVTAIGHEAAEQKFAPGLAVVCDAFLDKAWSAKCAIITDRLERGYYFVPRALLEDWLALQAAIDS